MTTNFYLPYRPNNLRPAEHLLDPLPFTLTDLVALMASRAAIDRAARRVVFWAMCGVTFLMRSSSTNAAASYPLSAPSVMRELPPMRSIIASAASRSAVPVANVNSASMTKPLRFSVNACPR